MSTYPDTDEFEPTVQLAEEPEDEPDLAIAADDFDRELEDISTSEEDAVARPSSRSRWRARAGRA